MAGTTVGAWRPRFKFQAPQLRRRRMPVARCRSGNPSPKQAPGTKIQNVSLRAKRGNLSFDGLRLLRRCATRNDMGSLGATTTFRSFRHLDLRFVAHPVLAYFGLCPQRHRRTPKPEEFEEEKRRFRGVDATPVAAAGQHLNHVASTGDVLWRRFMGRTLWKTAHRRIGFPSDASGWGPFPTEGVRCRAAPLDSGLLRGCPVSSGSGHG